MKQSCSICSHEDVCKYLETAQQSLISFSLKIIYRNDLESIPYETRKSRQRRFHEKILSAMGIACPYFLKEGGA